MTNGAGTCLNENIIRVNILTINPTFWNTLHSLTHMSLWERYAPAQTQNTNKGMNIKLQTFKLPVVSSTNRVEIQLPVDSVSE